MNTRSMQPARRRRLAAVSIAAVMVLGACGSSDDAATAPPVTDATPTDESTVDEPDAAGGVIENSPSLAIDGEPLLSLERDAPDTMVGITAPVVTGQSFDGSDITIGGATDDPTMLVFLAHWCPHCNDEIPELLELRDAGDLPADLNIVGISTAVDGTGENFPPSEWIDVKGWDWPVLADTEASDAFLTFGGSGFPFTVMLDADGDVMARKSGSSSAADILAWIDASLLVA